MTSRCWSFVDDIKIKNFCSDYKKKVFFEIQLFIMKHVQWLNAMFINLKKINYTISDEKFQFCIFNLKIINFVCDSNDRFSEIMKMIKILKWFSCRNVSEVKIFLDVYVYYCIWIMNFIIIAFFIYRFLKTEKFFMWKKEQKNIVNILKLTLMIAFVL